MIGRDWNIQKGSDLDWSDNLNRIGESADIVALQEAPLLNDGWQTVNAPVDAEALFHAFAPGFESRQSMTGVMTVSSALPIIQCNLSSQEPFLRTPKATIVTAKMAVPYRVGNPSWARRLPPPSTTALSCAARPPPLMPLHAV